MTDVPETTRKIHRQLRKRNDTWPISLPVGHRGVPKSFGSEPELKLASDSGDLPKLENGGGRLFINQEKDPRENMRSGGDSKVSNHACPKCTAETLLLKIDPFRVQPQGPETSKRNCPESGTFTERRVRSQSTQLESRSAIAKSGLAQRSKSFGGNLQRCNNATVEGENGSLGRHVLDQRKEATLRRHYYPEGGWGYVIVTCSALVHFLGVGLQLAAPGAWHVTAEVKFHHPALHSAASSRRLERNLAHHFFHPMKSVKKIEKTSEAGESDRVNYRRNLPDNKSSKIERYLLG
ncbi:uncharacterized protein LOC124309475 [Neodiprion virginianus]|uniref:Uncharacterized protein LOC124295589 n=1 Tax=Neodiprion lecontei TaxID=441921 RepID=A0ABM3GNY4_NEOLC|nr:uncharacterized protein LOC124223732 [Neodiprion pinetum]XP_046601984.1 uncharacterized protein LOC124295589 [Neodiprion lecontei]XP_046629096.1 uncharacterized protein LOC124309475 [Neodiprion virginianus]